jgi:hypothetical protein
MDSRLSRGFDGENSVDLVENVVFSSSTNIEKDTLLHLDIIERISYDYGVVD